MSQTVLVSPYQAFTIYMLADLFQEYYPGSDRHDLYGAYWATLLQTGADRLEVCALEEQIPRTPILRDRVHKTEARDFGDITELLHNVFARHVRGWEEVHLQTQYVRTLAFATDLLWAVQRGANLAFFGPLAARTDVPTGIAPGLAGPLRNLLGSVQSLALAGVIPATSVDARNATIFQELVMSRLFEEYTDSHLILGDPNARLPMAEAEIRKKALRLINHNRKLLRIRKVTGMLIRITGDLLQPLFGTVSTSLSSRAAELLERAQSTDRNIVVYDLRAVFERTIYDMAHSGHVSRIAQGRRHRPSP